MKQLAIYCSPDLVERVVGVLDEAGVEGFLHLGTGTGNRFRPPRRVPRTFAWEATLLLVPGADEERTARVVGALREYAGACDVAPCMRIVISPVEAVY